tara:strand:+ start:2280 stop:2552 length:273 start_codon:yes stop_codon:yes gene_type:complete
MNWQEIIKDYRDPHGKAQLNRIQTISEGYEEQLVEEYQEMITELIHDLQEIQKLDNSSAITKRIVALIRGSNDMYGGDTLAEAFGYHYGV